jgi:hypothetical protein
MDKEDDGVKYLVCTSNKVFDCSGNDAPGKVVAILSVSTSLALGEGEALEDQKMAELEEVLSSSSKSRLSFVHFDFQSNNKRFACRSK